MACPADDAWAIVFLFYSSLHLVDGYLRTKAPRFLSENHGERNRAIDAAPELRQAKPAYRALKALSEQVRYDPRFVPTGSAFMLAREYAEKIRAIVEPKLQSKLAP